MNVHPQKLEVRFRDPNAVHSLVHRGLVARADGRQGCGRGRGGRFRGERGEREISLKGEEGPRAPTGSALGEGPARYGRVRAPRATEPSLDAIAPGISPSSYSARNFLFFLFVLPPLGTIRLLGQYRDSFLVAESEDGLVLVDQHVAHERVRYESFLARLESAAPASQSLLEPVVFEASPGRGGAPVRLGGAPLGQRASRCRSSPAARFSSRRRRPRRRPRRSGPRSATISRASRRCPRAPRRRSALRREVLAASLACRGAITINHRLAPAEAARLLARPRGVPGSLDVSARTPDRPLLFARRAREALREARMSLRDRNDLFAPKLGLTMPLCGLHFIFFFLVKMDPVRTFTLFGFDPGTAFERPWTFLTYQFLHAGAVRAVLRHARPLHPRDGARDGMGNRRVHGLLARLDAGRFPRGPRHRERASLGRSPDGRLAALRVRIPVPRHAVPDLLRHSREGEVARLAGGRRPRVGPSPGDARAAGRARDS